MGGRWGAHERQISRSQTWGVDGPAQSERERDAVVIARVSALLRGQRKKNLMSFNVLIQRRGRDQM